MVDADARQAWRAAASTTSWAAASTATRPTSAGWCRTSRRCCTTTPSSAASTSRRSRSTGDAVLPPGREETLDYVLREMTDAEGGLLLDPGRRQRGRGGQVLRLDAGGGDALLGPEDGRRSTRSTTSTPGQLRRAEYRQPAAPVEEWARAWRVEPEGCGPSWTLMRARCYEVRSRRVWPGLDDKS